MSGSKARFLFSLGTLAALVGLGSTAHAEQPIARKGSLLLQATPSRDAPAPGSARNWGLSYTVDEAYAGPWANSPYAPAVPHVPARAFITPFDRNAERAPASSDGTGSSTSDASARRAESMLKSLGPVSLLASIVLPALMASSSMSGRIARNDVTPRVGFARLGGGYGVLVAGRFH